MNNHLRNMLLGILLAGAVDQAYAGDISANAVLGGGAGAAVGSAIGGRNGAMIGGALGAATGVAVATPRERPRVVNYYEGDDDGWHEHHDHGRHLGHYKHHDHD